jgi:hypothetical protein
VHMHPPPQPPQQQQPLPPQQLQQRSAPPSWCQQVRPDAMPRRVSAPSRIGHL